MQGDPALARLFISHSSKNNDWAIALKDWLTREGWSGPDDVFLDLDPAHGIVAGQRWATALEEAATRCEAVLFLVSSDWLSSKWCGDEYQLASKLNKKLFALLTDDIAMDRLPGGLTTQWQVVKLKGEPAERFLTVHPVTGEQSPVHVAEIGLKSLKRGLEKAGIGPETFELQADPSGPFGWRSPYRGLEALEPEDAAVFFGRSADIMRGMDVLRGVASHKAPRLLAILGASGAGKSSFLRAGIWPRLARDDGQWLPFRAIRAGRGSTLEGREGLLSALEEVHRRFALPGNRAQLRQRLTSKENFVALLRELRQLAGRRALISGPPFPLPVLCLDQGEELFAPDAGAESAKLLDYARAAMDADEALVIVAIRSDSYGLMQAAKSLVGVNQVPLSLGPVPPGEIARIIREPSELLRKKAGPSAPVLDAAVVERLLAEIEGEADALPLLAFVLQRLMTEHTGTATIGIAELEMTGGVGAAIESEAEAALADAGFEGDHAEQRDKLKRLFIPRLSRIDRESRAPQRRVARQADLPADLKGLARALTKRRLLVVKLAAEADGTRDATTIEVAHEALLRHWPTLAELLAEERDALLLLDGVLLAASEWAKADAARKPDFLTHRGSRLVDALAFAARGADWEREIAPARAYLAACQAREAAEQEEREAALVREQQRLAQIAEIQAETARQLDRGRVHLLSAIATSEGLRGNLESSLRLSVHAARLDLRLNLNAPSRSAAGAALATAAWRAKWLALWSLRRSGTSFAAFVPEGLRVIAASDGVSQVMDAATGAPVAALYGATDWTSPWALSPDSRHVARVARDNLALVVDGASGREIAALRGHEKAVLSVKFSPDGSRIATDSDDETLRIWDAATGKESAVLRGRKEWWSIKSFNADGSRIVTAADDNAARVWDTATGGEIAVLKGHEKPVRSAVFSTAGGRVVTASGDDEVRVWDASTGAQVAVLSGHGGNVLTAAFNVDGSRIVTASWDKTAMVWDAATGQRIAVLAGHEKGLRSAGFSPDGRRVVTASDDKTVRVWDAATGREIAALMGHGGIVWSAAFGADGTRIVSTSEDNTVRVWEGAGGGPTAVLAGHGGTVTSAAFSPDGRRVVTGSEDGTARAWDAATGQVVAVVGSDAGSVWFAAFSHDGKRIVTAAPDETPLMWDAATGKQIAALRGHEKEVRGVAFSPDGARIVTLSCDETTRFWDAQTGDAAGVARGSADWEWISSAAFSPDGSRVVTLSWDETARVWDAANGEETAILTGHEHVVSFASFNADGTRIVTASADNTARIWDAATGGEVAILRGHENGVLAAGFSPDGSRIVTASWDKTARLWDAAAGKEIAVLRGHEDVVQFAAFSPDGQRIITASRDATARIWDVRSAVMSTPELIAGICRQRLRGATLLSREEMRLAGYPDSEALIDVGTGAT
ncbi:MAG: TIR domain-containing protein [Alphaproteobacteria bacterium]|nr:TIR domain-containing protein [Alphaproteobacteria bacterium]